MRRFVPPVPRRASYVRLFAGIVVAVGLALTTISAQIPGRNINMVAGNTWPDGDPYLQRQNEPSIGASTRNPLHLLAGANDYRSVDLPGLAAEETGDAWLGLFKSFDGGQRWQSTLLPGYPQDHSSAGLTSPIHGYGAGADPVVRAGTNGLMYFAGLVFDRANPATPDVPGKSAIFVSRFIDNNNKEAGDPFEYLGTRALQADPGGATGNFLDKPWMVVDIPRDTSRCTIVTAGEKGPITQNIPAGPVYVAYTLRSTDNKGARYDVYFTRSADCGNTWSTPVRLNSNNERANQGASMAIDPRNGNVYIAWRQFDVSANATGTDALMTAKFTLGSKKLDGAGFAHKFAKPKKGKGKGLDLNHFYKKGGVNKALEAAELSPLDQSTSASQIRFRTNAYPSMAIDESGRVYLAWAERGFDPLSPDPLLGAARVLMATSLDGQSWTTAAPVSSENQKGHQLMPSLTYAGGKLMLIYYDIRDTRSQSFGRYIEDRTAFNDPSGTGLRNTIDLRASMASPGATPVFAPSVAVSEYIEGPRIPGGPNVPWQVNPPNLPMFQQGTAPFIGDYVDIAAAPNFVVNPAGKWTYNNAAGATPPIFHAAWTDNRDVRVPLVDANGDGNPWNDYAPVGSLGNVPSIFDPSQVVPQCIAGNAGSRNQNIYTARITGGLLVGSPGNSKRLGERLDAQGNDLGELIQRSFVVFAQNTADTERRFRFSITNQPVGGRASFDQFAALPSIDATIPYRSTASRTVYATSTDPHAIINVTIAELELVNNVWQVKSGGLGGTVVLNPDIDNPDIDNPDIDNPDIDNPDIDNAEVYNPDIDNPDIDNPDIDNPDIDNPDIDNPDIDNIRVANPDIDNPDIDNPDIDNPDIDNPDIDNPDIDNPDIDNASLMSDVTWAITNTGNTTASYNVNLFFAQQTFDPRIKTQLLLYRTYKTPVVRNCELKTETHNVLVTNVPNPQLVKSSTGDLASPNDPSAANATIYLAPGESAKITLRVFDPNPPAGSVITVTNPDGTTGKISSSFVPNEDVTPVIQQQPVNTEDVDNGVVVAPPVVQFPPPQTVPDSASTSESTPVTINPLANDSTAFGSTKIFSFHPAGMAAHSGGPAGDVAFQTSTGFLYTQRGAIDPATNALVGRFPLPAGGAPVFALAADVRSGINYGRTAGALSALSAFDARPDSPTFHQYLAMPAVTPATDTVLGFAIDAANGRLYAVHGPVTPTAITPTTVSVIDISPGSPTFHQIIRTVGLGNGVRAQSIAVNSRTHQVYVATSGTPGSPGVAGGVFVFDDSVAAPTAARNTSTAGGAWGIVVNEASNLVFASTITSGNVAAVYAIDGATGAVALISLGVPFRFGSVDERMAVHQASGKVLVRMESTVSIIDGQRGSPSRNTVVATLNVGRENGGTDIAVDEQAGRAITVGSYAFQADVIDINSNALAGTIPLSTFGQDVAIDPIHHRAFVSVFTYVQVVDLVTMQSIAGPPVFIESGGILLNPVKNKAYAGLFNTQADIQVLSAAGSEGSLAGIQHRGRYLSGEWHNHTNRGFIVDQGDSAGVTSEPGSVLVIDGATETVLGSADVLPGPFGLGIDQNADKVYVASLSAPFAHGGLTIVDPTNGDTTQATFTAAFPGSYPNFPLNNAGALLGFGRYVVANPATGKVYTLQLSGGSAASAAVYNPQTNAMTPLDGIAGSPLFDAANPGACGGAAPACISWGRVSVIRVAPSLNRVYLGLLDDNNVGRIVMLDAATNAVLASVVVGSHSNRHTPSFLVVNEAHHLLYVTDYTNNTVTALNADTLDAHAINNLAAVTSLPGGPSATAFNATANRLYVSAIDAKTIYAIDGSTLQVISSVKMPLSAYFMWVDEVESRIYASGGDNADESGAMIITDVLGQLGTNVSVTNVGSAAHGTTVLNADGSVTYTPAAGYAGTDSFNYTITAPNGTAVGSVSINVVPSMPAVVAFGDAYATSVNQLLTVPAPGPLANDATGSSATTMTVDDTTDNGVLTSQADGSFTYQPHAGFTGVDSFVYHAVTDSDGSTNPATVTITVGSATSLVVTNTSDSGAGSLRQAMSTANLEPGSTISFNIPGTGPFVIQPATALPILTEPTTIDGYTQPGSSPNTSSVGSNAVIQIQLRGNAVTPSSTNGIQITGGGSTIRGLAIGGFTGNGILLDVTGGNTVAGNFIGVNPNGTTANGNAQNGVSSTSLNNIIGGGTAAARNVISGNAQNGVRIAPRLSGNTVLNDGSGALVAGNLIGTDATGSAALQNTNAGISVNSPATTIGGAAATFRNVISGNALQGISAFPISSGNVALTVPSGLSVQGNWIGVKADGSAALGNGGGGVSLSGPNSIIGGSAGTTPGGACTGACNVISGNSGIGVNVSSVLSGTTPVVISVATGTQVVGNYIGLNPGGTAAIGNGTGLQITAAQAQVGGTTAAERNVIAGNNGSGIFVGAFAYPNTTTLAVSGANSVITGNYIGVNAAGTTAIGNNTGIAVSAPAVRIGGITAGERNVISGNNGPGISSGAVTAGAPGSLVVLTTGANLAVQGNYIGVSADASAARPNLNGGVFISASNATIGGTANATAGACTGACNLISGNNGPGVNIGASFENVNAGTLGQVYAQGNDAQIFNNFIGVNLAGNAAIANTSSGVQINAPNAIVGGSTPAQRNVISGNGTNAINIANTFVTSTNATVTRGDGAVIRGNYIGLGANGVTTVANASILGGSIAVIVQAAAVTFGGPGAADGNYLFQGGATALSVQRHTNGAALINSGGTNTIQGNTIGLDTAGARLNGLGGLINVTSAGNQILNNVIAGNGTGAFPTPTAIAVAANPAGIADSNVIRGNFIGTNAAGAAGLHNFGAGISVFTAAGTVIGGPRPGDGNVIVGGNDIGIFLSASSGNTTANTTIAGNKIGIMPDGMTAQDPTHAVTTGIELYTSGGGSVIGTVIGGSTADERNIVAGNSHTGIALVGASSSNTTVRGNYIGMAADGVTARPNVDAGVSIAGGTNNVIGGPNAADGNVIAGNGLQGVVINAAATGNQVLSNRIEANGALGIDVGGDGVTTNDGNDNDTGANDLQNFPVIANADNSGPTTRLDVDMSSFHVGNYTVQFFSNTVCDASGYGEGQHLVGTRTVTQPGTNGLYLDEVVPGNQFLTATATDSSGNTSEFSQCLPVSNPTIVANTNLSGPGSLAAAMTYANNTPGTQTITFNVPGASAASPGVISLGGTAMPIITESVVIDATTQPGYDGKPVIELAGNNNVSNGFETAPDVAGVTIKGFAITTFSGFGIALAQAENQAGDVVQQNYIGTDRFGSAGKGNGSGMRVRADASSVVNNVISGNQSTGVLLDNDANNVTVASNQIGTMADGLTGRANGGDGIALDHSSHDNTIISNTIALNGAWGINALHSLAAAVSGTQIRSNYIGTNASGAALGNGSGGIRLDSTPATQIGGTSGAGNTIAFNTGSGIVALGAAQARIQENSIYSNSVLGIDLNGDGVTANDGPADSDSGPNGLQNFVTMLSASTTGSQNTVVSFDANQLNPGNLFTVEFFAGGACHTVGYGEGMAFAGSTVVTGGSGNAQFTIGLSVAVGQIITATVSDSAGNTSEFSNCVTVQAAPPQITSVEPAAFAAGQMITINGANFSAQNLADVVIRQASSEVTVSYVWMYSPTKIIARTSLGVANGPAQVVVKTNQTTPESALNVTIQTQEGAPNFMHMRNGNCGGFGGPGDTSQTWSGGDLYLVASGIDTNGVEAVFTPQTGGAAVVVQAYLACGFPGGGDIAAQVQVPALPLGNYNVTMRSNSVGHESLDSNAKPLQIVSIFVNAVSGGQANSNGPGGPFPPQTIGTIKNGQQVVFSASGTAQYNGTSTSGPAGTAGACGPSCLAPALNAHALIGRFNGGAWFLIGAGTTVTNSNGQGWLELAMNDDDYSDNAGGWTVIVSPQ